MTEITAVNDALPAPKRGTGGWRAVSSLPIGRVDCTGLSEPSGHRRPA